MSGLFLGSCRTTVNCSGAADSGQRGTQEEEKEIVGLLSRWEVTVRERSRDSSPGTFALHDRDRLN